MRKFVAVDLIIEEKLRGERVSILLLQGTY